MTDFNWTDEAVKTLTRLDAEGMSFAQIGAFLGISRNAAIGKARRINLPFRTMEVRVGNYKTARKANGREPVRKPRQPRVMTKRFTNHGTHFDMVEVYSGETIGLAPETSPVAVPLLKLEPQHCRWPVSPDDAPLMLFCGASKIKGCSYCERHWRIGHQHYSPAQDAADRERRSQKAYREKRVA